MTDVHRLTLHERRALRSRVLDELARMDDQVDALARSFADIVEAATATSTDDEHDPEGSTIAFERAQVSALLRRARADRDDMRATKDRLDDPGFGVCAQCGCFIGLERLLALTSATSCITCAR